MQNYSHELTYIYIIIYINLQFNHQTSDTHNELLVKKINSAKNIHLVASTVKDKYIIRFAVCSKLTNQEDIEYSWKEIQRQAHQLLIESNENKFNNMALQTTTTTSQAIKLNGKITVPCINRSASEVSVVNLPRLGDLKTAYANLLEAAGEDIHREGLLKTPERAAKAFQFFTAGYHQDIKGKNQQLLVA